MRSQDANSRRSPGPAGEDPHNEPACPHVARGASAPEGVRGGPVCRTIRSSSSARSTQSPTLLAQALTWAPPDDRRYRCVNRSLPRGLRWSFMGVVQHRRDAPNLGAVSARSSSSLGRLRPFVGRSPYRASSRTLLIILAGLHSASNWGRAGHGLRRLVDCRCSKAGLICTICRTATFESSSVLVPDRRY